MNLEEYKNRLKQLEKIYIEKKQSLAIQYALSNNTIEVGQIIQDNQGYIQVENISTTILYNNVPCCIYSGIELKKDLTPKKVRTKRDVYQTNLIN